MMYYPNQIIKNIPGQKLNIKMDKIMMKIKIQTIYRKKISFTKK